MKKLLLFIFIISFLSAKGQQEDLFDNTWYLEKVILDEEEHPVHIDECIEYVSLNFDDNSFETNIVNFYWSEPEFNFTENYFTLTHIGGTLTGCNQESDDYEGLYMSFFNGVNFEVSNPFYFEITNGENDSLKLEITNENGDIAIYSSIKLSLQEDEKLDFEIYPNPFSGNKITIELSINFSNSKIELKDLTGKTLDVKNINHQNKINYFLPTNLNSGVYVITITDLNNNKVITKRLVKE
ncbi:T9SS type A sorting domain-containing protein [Aureivirga sp. CE67]|uniref:T9SS type A sorting domain-containing protein n=1 Tax=Aureivirga sp. CE67 TaxID=1788983 RepID=UPI0018CA1B0E|nr:T9SS type A sorting domain-containing protein [Aureivirga sp. CE67]